MKGLSGIKRTPLRNLAEAIILQAIEDLWNSRLRNESIDFFRGEGFMRYARMAGMTRDEVFRILAIAKGPGKVPITHFSGETKSSIF